MNMSDRLTWSLFLKYLYDIYMNLPMFVHLFFYMKSIHEHVQIVCFPELQLKWFSPRTYQYLKVSKFAVLQKKDLEAVCYPTFILGGGGKGCGIEIVHWNNFLQYTQTQCICWLYKDGFWLASMSQYGHGSQTSSSQRNDRFVFLSICYSLKLFIGIYPRSPSQGDIPNKYPLYRVCIWLIIFRVSSQG